MFVFVFVFVFSVSLLTLVGHVRTPSEVQLFQLSYTIIE